MNPKYKEVVLNLGFQVLPRKGVHIPLIPVSQVTHLPLWAPAFRVSRPGQATPGSFRPAYQVPTSVGGNKSPWGSGGT